MLPTNVVSKKGSASRSLSLALALAIGSRVESRESPRCVAGIKYTWSRQAAERAKRLKTKLESKLLGKILAVPGVCVCDVCVRACKVLV